MLINMKHRLWPSRSVRVRREDARRYQCYSNGLHGASRVREAQVVYSALCRLILGFSMSEKQLIFILALIGIVAFTAWVVHQSIPSALMTAAHHTPATNPAGSTHRQKGSAHAPVSAAASAARVEIVAPVTHRQSPSPGISVVAIHDRVAPAGIFESATAHATTMQASGLKLSEGYEQVSGTAAALLPPVATANTQPVLQPGLDFDAVPFSHTHK